MGLVLRFQRLCVEMNLSTLDNDGSLLDIEEAVVHTWKKSDYKLWQLGVNRLVLLVN